MTMSDVHEGKKPTFENGVTRTNVRILLVKFGACTNEFDDVCLVDGVSSWSDRILKQ